MFDKYLLLDENAVHNYTVMFGNKKYGAETLLNLTKIVKINKNKVIK